MDLANKKQIFQLTVFHPICGQYYKHITIINYDSSIVNKFVPSLTDNTRVIIYDHHMFVLQASGVNFINIFHACNLQL